ncbi:MAG: GspH/FimT family pseudopilin [Rhodoferax sp.]|nr:GspH/FimT family pseudopilin [Rhodoferax sp.]
MLVKTSPLGRGVTLVELLVALTILAIGLTLAAPSFTSYQRNAELTATANLLLASLNTARSEATKRGMNTMLIPVDAANWAQGWTVFVNADGTANPTSANNMQIATQPALPAYLAVVPPAGLVGFTFDASGYAIRSAGTLQIRRIDVVADQALSETRKVIVAASGRVKTCRPSAVDDPNC